MGAGDAEEGRQVRGEPFTCPYMPKRAYIPYVPTKRPPFLTPVVWVERSRSELKRLSEQVQHVTGVALQKLQRGGFPREAVPLHGDLAGLIEIKVDDPGGTYRTVLTVKLAGAIYVPTSSRRNRHRESPCRAEWSHWYGAAWRARRRCTPSPGRPQSRSRNDTQEDCAR